MEKTPCFNELSYSISESEISKALLKLKCGKAPGMDNISNYMIKYGQSMLMPCFKNVFNAVLSNGLYPNCWADGFLTLLHKSGEQTNPNNYRGITITSAIGKLFNNVLNNRLDAYLSKHKIIDECQIGFTKQARTSDHMFVIKSIIDKYCHDKSGRVFACFVDFQKAFDTVIHTGIKLKLLDIGISSSFYNVIKSMYNNSKSCIRVLQDKVTEFFSLNVGVKQGDNLSPNLFKIFINDLPQYLNSTCDPIALDDKHVHCLMYADDVVLLSTSAIGLQQKLDQLQKFCHDWCLNININKTKIIVFNKAGRLIKQSFLFEKQNIECVKSYRYLGIHFTSSGSFTLAQRELYNKALKAFFALQRDFLSSHPNIKTSLHVFEHTIIPILLYGCEVWGSFNTFTARFRNSTPPLDHIYSKHFCEKLHIKFSKFILGVQKKCTNFAVLSELGRFPLCFNITKHMLSYWYRLDNLETSFPILKAAYMNSKNLHATKQQSWYGSINYILNTSLLCGNQLSKLKPATFKKRSSSLVKSHFIENWHKSKGTLSNGKLETYFLHKQNFGFEKYLALIPYEQRCKIARFRTSSHTLEIERGRYKGIARELRYCKKCTLHEVEDEIHFLFKCTNNKEKRDHLLLKIKTKYTNFPFLDHRNMLIWLMTTEDRDILIALADLISMM